MAGGHMKYRHLGRTSSHRQALLRNLVTSLFTHESIQTTWPKAKEAQRLAEQLITLGKKNTEASKRRALSIFFTPHELMPKLFGTLRERYADRRGGYTRVLRIEPLKNDQAPSAILELVDGPKDMRFAMTAMTLARIEAKGHEVNDITAKNIAKVTRFREGGEDSLREMVDKLKTVTLKSEEKAEKAKEQPVPQDTFKSPAKREGRESAKFKDYPGLANDRKYNYANKKRWIGRREDTRAA